MTHLVIPKRDLEHIATKMEAGAALDELWQDLCAVIAQGREIDPEAVTTLIGVTVGSWDGKPTFEGRELKVTGRLTPYLTRRDR